MSQVKSLIAVFPSDDDRPFLFFFADAECVSPPSAVSVVWMLGMCGTVVALLSVIVLLYIYVAILKKKVKEKNNRERKNLTYAKPIRWLDEKEVELTTFWSTSL